MSEKIAKRKIGKKGREKREKILELKKCREKLIIWKKLFGNPIKLRKRREMLENFKELPKNRYSEENFEKTHFKIKQEWRIGSFNLENLSGNLWELKKWQEKSSNLRIYREKHIRMKKMKNKLGERQDTYVEIEKILDS